MDTFPMTIQSLFEGKSTGTLRTTKLITDTVIIQLFKSFFYWKFTVFYFYGIVHQYFVNGIGNVILAYKQTAFSE